MPPRTILLVDADPLQRQLVDMLLAEDGPEIVNAGSGREALEYLKEHTPHLVIMALELPDIGGDVVCGKLKSVTRLARVPVLLTVELPKRDGLSADVRERARSVGADLLLPKPLGDKNLRDRVRRLLSRWDTPSGLTGRSTRNTVVIEQALEALGSDAPHADAGAVAAPSATDPATDALYRENEELRREVAALKRQLARIESGLGGHDGPPEPTGGIVNGAQPADVAVHGQRSPDGGETGPRREPTAARAGDEPQGRVEELERRVREMERRNKALLEALEEAKTEVDDTPRGLFKRRRT